MSTDYYFPDLKAVTGSNRAAARAGKTPKPKPMAKETPMARIIELGLITSGQPKPKAVATTESRSDKTTPKINPKIAPRKVMTIASQRNCHKILFLAAPTDLRKPI